jgi:hypothetical protein
MFVDESEELLCFVGSAEVQSFEFFLFRCAELLKILVLSILVGFLIALQYDVLEFRFQLIVYFDDGTFDEGQYSVLKRLVFGERLLGPAFF